MKWQGASQVEVESLEDKTLHAADVSLAVGVVSDVDEVCDLWCVHLLVLRRYEHRSDAD